MLNSQQVVWLLGDLCTKLGFCLSPEAQRLLHEAPPETPELFADAVFRAEGLERWPSNRQLYKQVLAECEHAFAIVARVNGRTDR